MKWFFKDQKGSVAVVVALSMVVLIGFAALAVDGGFLYYRHTRLQDIADAAALAAAHQMAESATDKENEAFNKAVEYVGKHKLSPVTTGSYNADITFAGDESGTMTVSFPDEKKVRVDLKVDAKLYLARVLDKLLAPVEVYAVAEIGIASEATGDLIPVAFYHPEPEEGKLYEVTLGPGDSLSGNSGFLEFPPSASDFKEYMYEGYDGTLSKGQLIPTYTGENVGQVVPAIEYRITNCGEIDFKDIDAVKAHLEEDPDCPRLVTVPIVNEFLSEASGKTEITIDGFATFFITEYVKKDKILKGYFIEDISASGAAPGDSEFMTKAVRLVE